MIARSLFKKVKEGRFGVYLGFMNVSFLCYLVGFIKGILARRYVDPSDYGFFVQCQQVVMYGSFLQFGVFNAVNFELPQMIAGKRVDRVNGIIGSSLGYIASVSLLIALVSPLCFAFDLPAAISIGLFLSGIDLVLQLGSGLIQSVYRGKQEYRSLNRILFIKSIIDLGSTIVLTRVYGYWGLFAGNIISGLFIVAYSYRDFRSIRPVFSTTQFRDRIRIGFPIFLSSTLWALIPSLCQTIGLLYLSKAEIGVFSIAILGYTAVSIVPSIFSQIVYPKLIVLANGENGGDDLSRFCIGIMRIYLPLVAIITAMVVLLVPLFIKILLPSYVQGIRSAKILMLSMLAIAPNSLVVNILVSMRRNKRIIVTMLLTIAVTCLASFFLVRPMGIDGLGLAMALAISICYVINYFGLKAAFSKQGGRVFPITHLAGLLLVGLCYAVTECRPSFVAPFSVISVALFLFMLFGLVRDLGKR